MQGLVSATTMKYDYLVYAVGAETQTFNIPGVRENACFMKELDDAEKVRRLNFAISPGVHHICRCNVDSSTVSSLLRSLDRARRRLIVFCTW